MVITEREADKLATCWHTAERTSLAVKPWVGSSAELRGNWRRAAPESLVSFLCPTRSERPEPRRVLLHVLRAWRPTGSLCRLSVVVLVVGGGRKVIRLTCHPREKRSVD